MRKLIKISLVCLAGTFILAASPKTVYAYEEGVAGFVFNSDSVAKISSKDAKTMSFSEDETPIPGYINIGIANVDKGSNLLIRKDPKSNGDIIGKLPNNGGCEVVDVQGDWTKIKAKTDSGELNGYVKSEYLITGNDALKLAKQVGNYMVRAKEGVEGLRVRDEATTVDSHVVDQIDKGEALMVLDQSIDSNDPDHPTWVKVALDSDENENDAAFIAKDCVDLSFELVHAVSIEELQYGSGVTSTRKSLIDMAKDHLGEAYVWGGTWLGHGVDCSGFTQALYRQLGYSIPRTSRSQAASGHTISANELRAGDLVFYGSSGYISHVAMYIGGGQIIHASNRRDGIKISNMNYRTPIKCVRYIND